LSATEPQTFVRPDGKEKVTGVGRYTADLAMAGQLHARFRYADHPRARIVSIDASRARAVPGVFAVMTHEDVPDVLYGQLVKDRRLFAKQEVRFEADVVAAVAAMTPEAAQDAVGLIDVEYEPLPPVTDPEQALDPNAPLVHPDWRSYEAGEGMVRDGNVHTGCRSNPARSSPSGRAIA
jgi:CO/xanthine dehydrogenase Mo-binding subunit